jgi:tripartite-type tricarboxylate transporter receptor subunit TctC
MKRYGAKRFFSVHLTIMICAVCMAGGAARAAGFPEHTVTVLFGTEPGSANDLISRAAGVGAERVLGQKIVFENKPGGGGSVALSILATQKPDGYTIAGAPNVAVVDMALMQKVAYKPLKSFTPIFGLANAEHTALLVKSDAPWKTAKEFFAHAKANPGKIKYSTGGVGSGMHVVMEYIASKEGIKWTHIPYKGSPSARTAILGGHVHACSAGLDWPPYVQSGDLRVLATHGKTRFPLFPDVPTMKELGYDVTNDTVHCILGPAGLPADVTKKLEEAFAKGQETEEFKTVREKLYLTPLSYNSKQLEQHLKEFWAKEEKMMKEVGVITEAATQPE